MKKGFKVTDKKRSKLVGIACNSLNELVEKGRQKLAINEDVIVALNDGTIVDDDDYFLNLPSQTILVLYKQNESVLTGVDFLLNALREVNNYFLDTGVKAKELLSNKAEEIVELLKKFENKNVEKNSKSEDPDWFQDLETNVESKDEYMNKKSQDRIRGYLYKFQEDVRKNNSYVTDSNFRKTIEKCLNFFKNRLKMDGYFGCYLDRRFAVFNGKTFSTRKKIIESSPEKKKLKTTNEIFLNTKEGENFKFNNYDKLSYCDSFGNFVCQGLWKEDKCTFDKVHCINPYASRETRIIFSTWNFDHRIERSRTITPTLLRTVEKCEKHQTVNYLYFYELLFTKLNLKLVHVVCHDKSIHQASCDLKYLYV